MVAGYFSCVVVVVFSHENHIDSGLIPLVFILDIVFGFPLVVGYSRLYRAGVGVLVGCLLCL